MSRQKDILIVVRKKAHEVGLRPLAAESGLARETLYRTLGENGNPRLSTLKKLCAVLGLRMTIE